MKPHSRFIILFDGLFYIWITFSFQQKPFSYWLSEVPVYKVIWLSLAIVTMTSLSLAAFWFGSNYGDGFAITETVSNTDRVRAADNVGEGIKVHGDWELTVSDPGGANAIVYNFTNSLWANDLLVSMMLPYEDPDSHEIVDWSLSFRRDLENVGVNTQGVYGFTFVNDPRGLLCEVLADAKIESKSPLSLPGKNNLLTSLVLGGSCYVEADGNGDVFTAPQELYEVRTIAQSRTNVQGVPGAVLSRTSNFTNKRLDEPITVSPGQLIAAIVRIRFE